jgi:hypothetical protein
MKFVALFALCSLLFYGGIYPQADADGAIPTALKRFEIVFVDTGVANRHQLLADVQWLERDTASLVQQQPQLRLGDNQRQRSAVEILLV